ncbi:MAG: trigger factor, partial [Rikenellaceae bacterium]
MIIVKENLENQVELIKVTVEAADYATTVENALKNYKKKANIPGFRPGMVPMGVIKKMYYKGVLAEETYRIASYECYKYMQDNKIEFLGDPIPAASQPALDFDTMESFEFHFKVGVASPIKLDLNKLSLKKYKLAINDELREGYKNNLLNRFGQLVDVDVVSKDEAVSVTLKQEDMTIEDAYVGLISMSDEERAPFIGKKVGDVMEVNVNELYKSPSQRASILSMKEEELANLNPLFTLTITRIRKFALPTLTPEFFEEA